MSSEQSKKAAAIMHGWMAERLEDEDISNLKLARMDLKGSTLNRYFEEIPIPLDEGRAIIRYLTASSYFWNVIYQHIGFDETNRVLIEKVELEEDGQFNLGNNPDRTIGTLNTFFANILTTGNRLIESTERNLKKCFKEDIEAIELWKKITKAIYDTDLAYVLCKKLRNIYEHDNVLINITELNLETRRAYAVVNLEHELGGKGIPLTQDPVAAFLIEREQTGIPPRKNIGFILRNYFSDVTSLAIYALTKFQEEATNSYEKASSLFQALGNEDLCVVVSGVKRKGFPNLGIFPINSLELIQKIYVEYAQYYKTHFDLVLNHIFETSENE